MKIFEGKVALVTGGTSGIGEAAALAFARQGAKTVVSGRREKEGEAIVGAIRCVGGEAIFVKADVSKDADVQALVEKTVVKFGRLDFAFNNAGVEEVMTSFADQAETVFDQVMDVNVKGVWLSMKYEIPAMLKNGGSIVNTSSVAGLVGMAMVPVYVASKHAVNGLTKSAALEFSKKGIRINAVAPAAIDTRMYRDFASTEDMKKFLASLHPIGRIGRVEEVAGAVMYLCSEQASFITGQILPVDGGFTAQ